MDIGIKVPRINFIKDFDLYYSEEYTTTQATNTYEYGTCQRVFCDSKIDNSSCAKLDATCCDQLTGQTCCQVTNYDCVTGVTTTTEDVTKIRYIPAEKGTLDE